MANTMNDKDEYAFIMSLKHIALTTSNPGQAENITEIYDMGASTHMSPYHNLFTSFTSIELKGVRTADKTIFNAYGQGNMQIAILNGEKQTTLTLKNVLYTPDITFTLISMGRCDNAGFSSTFADGKCSIQNPVGTTIAQIPHVSGVYQVTPCVALNASTAMTISQLHQRMGHISPTAVTHMIQKNLVKGIDLDMKTPIETCKACINAKIVC